MRGDDYPELRDALDKLHLNDAGFVYEPESSVALGFGFRCGFLGLLHMEITQERLEREFDLDLIASAPSVEYRVKLLHGADEVVVDNPAQMPDPGEIERISEPWVAAQVITPTDYIGPLMELATNRRAEFQNMEYLDPKRVNLHFEMPLGELIIDFYDQLKSRSSGYASLDYTYIGYRPGDLVKLDVLVSGEPVDALSLIVHRSNAYRSGKALVEKLKELIPRQMFEVPVQAAIGSHIISRETIRAMRKNVLAKCYGGDITRKRKLLEKQKEGKQRMKRIGSVEIPQEAFLAVLRMNETRATRPMSFFDSLRLAIALGLTLFLVLLRFDSERITRSDYFRYRTPWMGPVSYYILVIGFAIGIAIILPSGREQLFLTGGDPDKMLPVMLLFSAVALLNGVALAFLRYGGILPLPTELLPSRVLGAAANAISEELQFRSIVLGMLLFAGVPAGWAIAFQALLYGLAHRRLWRERDWYFLAGSVLLGWAAGVATVETGSVIPAIVGHFAVTMACSRSPEGACASDRSEADGGVGRLVRPARPEAGGTGCPSRPRSASGSRRSIGDGSPWHERSVAFASTRRP